MAKTESEDAKFLINGTRMREALKTKEWPCPAAFPQSMLPENFTDKNGVLGETLNKKNRLNRGETEVEKRAQKWIIM